MNLVIDYFKTNAKLYTKSHIYCTKMSTVDIIYSFFMELPIGYIPKVQITMGTHIKRDFN